MEMKKNMEKILAIKKKLTYFSMKIIIIKSLN